MNQQNVDIFLAMNATKFPAESLYEIRDLLYAASEENYHLVHTTQYKDPSMMLVISIFAGKLGIDRFMLGQVGLGLLKLFTCGGLGIWTIIDFFTISKITKEHNLEKFKSLIQSYPPNNTLPNQVV